MLDMLNMPVSSKGGPHVNPLGDMGSGKTANDKKEMSKRESQEEGSDL